MKYLRQKEHEAGSDSTGALVVFCVRSVPAGSGGVDVAEMRNRIKVVEAVEKADGGTIAFEDAHAAVLQRCVAGMRWGAIHPGIVDFTDAVAAMPSEPPEEAPDEDILVTLPRGWSHDGAVSPKFPFFRPWRREADNAVTTAVCNPDGAPNTETVDSLARYDAAYPIISNGVVDRAPV